MTEPLTPEPRNRQAASPAASAEARHERQCIGCGQRCAPGDLIRLVLGPDGEVAVDAAGGGFGRGAHVHPRWACLANAVTRGLPRVTKGRAAKVSVAVKEGGDLDRSEAVPLTAESLAQAVRDALSRRVMGLLASAVRTRKVRIGADAATSAWQSGEAALLVVATDAAAAASLTAVREAIPAGAAVAWGTKQSLSAALFRPESAEGVGVAAITDSRIARAVSDAVTKMLDKAGSYNGPAPTPANQSKVSGERAGRASGRKLRRAQGKTAVVERSE